MNLAFIIPLKHAGLALAISLGACLNAGVLYSKLRSQGIYQPLPGWGIFIFKILVALIVMGAGLWLATGNSAEWFVLTATERAIKLGLVVILGGIGYFACLWMLGFRLRDFARQ